MNTEDSNGDIRVPAADSLEFRLLLAYTRKKRPADPRLQKNNTREKTPTPENHIVRGQNKNKRLNKRFSKLFRCIKPNTSDLDDDPRQPATLACDAAEEAGDMEKMVSNLTEISSSVRFTPHDTDAEIETDSEDDIVQKIVELLKEQGDQLNDKILADKALSDSLRSSLTYVFFRTVMDRFFKSVSPEIPPQDDEKTKVALICEATSKLFSVDHHPIARVLGFGATYLQEKFPTWISRNMDNGKLEEEEEEEEVQ